MAGTININFRPKQPKPTLNRARGLMHELIIASAPGAEGGPSCGIDYGPVDTVLDSNAGDGSLAKVGRSHWDVTVVDGNYPKVAPNGVGATGRGVKGFADTDSIKYGNNSNTGTAPDKWTDHDSPDGWSAAVLYRPASVQSVLTDIIWQRRQSPFGATNEGWSIGLNAAGGYRVGIDDSTAQFTLDSTTGQIVLLPQLIVATFKPPTLKLFVNGQLEASGNAGAILIGQSNLSPRLYAGVAGGGDFAHGMVYMNAYWNRELTQGEVNWLYVDPFIMWRDNPPPEGLDFGGGGGGGHGNGCDCCCDVMPLMFD